MRSLLLVLTLAAGPVVAVLLDRAPPGETALPVHGAISLFLPCLVILLDRDGRPVAIAALVVAAGVIGDLSCAVAGGGWDVGIAAGGLTTQGLAALVGLAFGRWWRRPSWACIAVTVVPLGAWAVLGAVGAVWFQAWLTPYGVIVGLLAGTPDAWVRMAFLAAAAVLIARVGPVRTAPVTADRAVG